MTLVDTALSPSIQAFVAQTKADAERAFRVLRDTGTLAINGTIQAVERVPNEALLVGLVQPGPFAADQSIAPVVLTFDGTIVAGPKTAGDPHGFASLLARRPEITTAVHIHSTYLGAWSQTHRPLPIRYVPVQRWTLASEIPVYIDRRQAQVDFILERLAENASTPAILEANGGATVWGTRGFLKTIEYAQLLEEGAQFQLLAESLGGSQPFGPGVLEQQFALSGLTDQARAAGRLR
jgi:ribulose-5-phosphate 4-epimerase/fuculose-1-phosphate aldolase